MDRVKGSLRRPAEVGTWEAGWDSETEGHLVKTKEIYTL